MFLIQGLCFLLEKNGGFHMFLTDSTKHLIQLALSEDIGRGDCTTNLVVSPTAKAKGTVWIKQPGCVAGLPVLEAVFHAVDPSIQIKVWVEDGQDVHEKTAVCEVYGPARAILSAERTALNFLARMSGVATLTQAAVRRLEGTGTKLLDTRKTTPGWRALEKYAVRIGGGYNHRFGLDDMILIKDNHIAIAGGVAEAIERARSGAAVSQKIEVEVDTLEQLDVALREGADLILLDNMDTETLRRAVERTQRRALLEASGNMTLERIREVAETGVDFISMGALTHSAVSLDVGLDIELV